MSGRVGARRVPGRPPDAVRRAHPPPGSTPVPGPTSPGHPPRGAASSRPAQIRAHACAGYSPGLLNTGVPRLASTGRAGEGRPKTTAPPVHPSRCNPVLSGWTPSTEWGKRTFFSPLPGLPHGAPVQRLPSLGSRLLSHFPGFGQHVAALVNQPVIDRRLPRSLCGAHTVDPLGYPLVCQARPKWPPTWRSSGLGWPRRIRSDGS